MITGLILGVAQAIYITCPANNPRGGKYDQQTHQITICQNFAEGEYVANHEFGHWVWFQKMTQYEKQKFIKMVKNESCINQYACSSDVENFAENAREYMIDWKPKKPTQFFIRSIFYKYGIK